MIFFFLCLLRVNPTHWQAAYTCDAGPNVVLMARNRETATVLLRRLLFHFPPNSTDLDR